MKTVNLVSIAGARIISGGNNLATGVVDLRRTDEIIARLLQKGFSHEPEPGALEVAEDTDIGREAYISMFGPTVGDRVRLGDTALWVEVEHDEVIFMRIYSLFITNGSLDRLYMAMKQSLVEVLLQTRFYENLFTPP